MTSNTISIGILGASGYTGAELVRLLGNHPSAEIRCLTADRHAGKSMSDVFPQLAGIDLPSLTRIEDSDLGALDAVFCCLPHGTTQAVISKLPNEPKVIDISADFRLRDPEVYAEWYGHPHEALHLQGDAVYGLTEMYRGQIRSGRLIACPGCYPTGALLPLWPLLEAGLIAIDGIIIDAKTGVTGGGRSAKQGMLHAEISEGMHAYAIGSHRHAPEIEQELEVAAGAPMTVTFTPHLVPMNRGILSTIYVDLNDGVEIGELQKALENRYVDEPFVQILPFKGNAATQHVRGSNQCFIAVHPGRVKGRAILVSVIDNLVKGASGQALQNMNVMFGLDETAGLAQRPLFP